MVLAAALISLAVLTPQAAAQAPPQAASQSKPKVEPQPAATDNSKPYSVDGVRKATELGTTAKPLPSVDATPVEPGRRGYRVVIDSRAVKPDPCSLLITACQPSWGGGANPTWHEQFIAMTGPPDYAVPYSGMSNVQTLQAVASSAAINLALQAVVSLIHDGVVQYNHDRKQRKIEKVRGEIRAEVDELERLNAVARKSGQTEVK